MAPDAASPFFGVLVMPKYENPAKKKVNFLQDSLCYWYRLFSASHRKTAEETAGRITRTTARTIIRSTKSVMACTTQTERVRFIPRL